MCVVCIFICGASPWPIISLTPSFRLSFSSSHSYFLDSSHLYTALPASVSLCPYFVERLNGWTAIIRESVSVCGSVYGCVCTFTILDAEASLQLASSLTRTSITSAAWSGARSKVCLFKNLIREREIGRGGESEREGDREGERDRMKERMYGEIRCRG